MIASQIKNLRHSLTARLIAGVGLTLLVAIFLWSFFNIAYQKKKIMNDVIKGADRLSTTIKLGTHYAMMINSRDDINRIINNIATQNEIRNIRIYNKEGEIKFSNNPEEVDSVTNIRDEACFICHKSQPPITFVDLKGRTRIFREEKNPRYIGIITPIYNEPGCSANCHVHEEDKTVLGALDVVVSLEETDSELLFYEKGLIIFAASLFLVTSATIFVFFLFFINRPIQRLIEGTRKIARGDPDSNVNIIRNDEIGQLADAVNRMGAEINEKQSELNKQKDEYRKLFELVPCSISVQDRNFRLIRYNREFREKFHPSPGDFCYAAYKQRDSKCENCPLENTFRHGKIHIGEESGTSRDGSRTHWMVITCPVTDTAGNIVAAMEMSLDLTQRKQLEEQLEKSEKKYHAFFNNIPNSVFVLDERTLDIRDCNKQVEHDYGFKKETIIDTSFLNFFLKEERQAYRTKIRESRQISQARQTDKNGNVIFVDIWISPVEHSGRDVLLVSTNDITKRLDTEQQLIQTSKLATLGEMSTGVAHELNQPLSVIKTASSFFMKKLKNDEPIEVEVLESLLRKIDKNTDRASNIISHMKQFARKSEKETVILNLNDTIDRAFEIFSQQLKLREITVIKEFDPDLPSVKGDPIRLEQVFINLLLNARDSIEEKTAAHPETGGLKNITLKTYVDDETVTAVVSDTGAGIPKEAFNKIFEPFFTTKEVGKGTGLGLSISYGIIKDCGGSITAETNEFKGADFIIRFPRQ